MHTRVGYRSFICKSQVCWSKWLEDIRVRRSPVTQRMAVYPVSKICWSCGCGCPHPHPCLKVWGGFHKLMHNVVLCHVWSLHAYFWLYVRKGAGRSCAKKAMKDQDGSDKKGGPGEVRQRWPSGEGNNHWSFTGANNKAVARWLIGGPHWLELTPWTSAIWSSSFL